MKIKNFFIRRYGPLNEKNYNLGGNFTLFFGKNEYGKTLTIDALVKLLLGKNIKDFEYIDRVDENPSGYVILEDDKGKEIKIPEKGNLTNILGLTSSECRNIFVIRNSDLSISNEDKFYNDVTHKLTGLRTEEILKIEEELKNIGKLTPKGRFKEIVGEKIKSAKIILKEIENLREEMEKKKFNEFEERYIKLKEEISSIEKEIQNLEDARKREKYEKGEKILSELKSNLLKLKDLEIYNENDAELWRDSERDIKGHNKEKESILSEIEEKEKGLKETEEKLSITEKDFKIFDERKKEIDSEIKPELNIIKEKNEELVKREVKSSFFNSLGITSFILLGISLFGIILTHSILFYSLTGLFFISSVIFCTFRFQFLSDKANLRKIYEKNRLILSKFGMEEDTIEGILLNIQKFDEEYIKKREELESIKRNKEILEDKIKELKDKKIPIIERKINEERKKIDKIKEKSGENSLEDYNKKLKSKKDLEKLVGEGRRVLENFFEKKSEKLEENIHFWEGEVRKLEEYKEKAKGIKYNEAFLTNLRKKKQNLEKDLRELGENMESIRKKMENLERKVNEILNSDEHLYCKTSLDLETVNNKLIEFIDENENRKDSILKSLSIFDEIEKEEKEKISALFGKESNVSKYFSEITDGLYKEVVFNQNTGEIEVRNKDGTILQAMKLSGGAYDQLYFSIRLALGEKLLKRKNFFIMDDPFIKSDPERLKREIETLKKISLSGWQILYFSAKGEIKEILKEDIRKGIINYVKIQNIF